MTLSLQKALYTLKKEHSIAPKALLSIKQMVVIIPVKDNQAGINRLLESFFTLTKIELYPAAIVIVDNNSKEEIKIPPPYTDQHEIKIHLIKCKKQGPAAARNAGAKFTYSHYAADWLLFMDSDCLFTKNTFRHIFIPKPDSIAYQLNIVPNAHDWLSHFYHEISTLRPLSTAEDGVSRPETLITAGALVSAEAFIAVNGFSEDFPDAAGEDLFLGYKLRTIGNLTYLDDAVIRHDFTEYPTSGVVSNDILNLIKRFYRYGKGNKLLELKLLTEFDAEVDRSSTVGDTFSREEFNYFLKIYCDPSITKQIPKINPLTIKKLTNTALYYGYENLPLFFFLPKIHRTAYFSFSFFAKKQLETLISERNTTPKARHIFDTELGLVTYRKQNNQGIKVKRRD